MRTTSSTRIRSRQRRIVALAAGPVLIAGMALAVSFTNSFADGTQVAGVRVNKADYVFPVKSGATMPSIDVADIPTVLKAGSILAGTTTNTVTNWRYPTWTIEDQLNGTTNATVDIEGDIALIDARGNASGVGATFGGGVKSFGTPDTAVDAVFPQDFALNRDNLKAVKVNMFIENMNEMQEAYDSYYLPIRVYKTTDAGATWTLVSGATGGVWSSSVDQSNKYLHSLDGTVSFTFPACEKCVYDVTIGTGGNLHVANAPTAVVPKLYFTATAINHANN